MGMLKIFGGRVGEACIETTRYKNNYMVSDGLDSSFDLPSGLLDQQTMVIR
jgi:hypothetical protein